MEILHGLGDTVCTLPMLSRVRETYPTAQITVLVKNAAGKDIVESSRIAVDEILVWDIYENIRNSIRNFIRLRRMHFDYAVSNAITPPRKARLFMKIVRPKQWVGWQTKGFCFDTLGDRLHFVEANLAAAEEICGRPGGKPVPRLYADEDCVKRLAQKLPQEGRKRVGVCIGDADYSLKNRWLRTGKVYTRSWGIDHMTELVGKLVESGADVVLIGGKAEMPLCENVWKTLGPDGRIVDFVGKTTMKESIALASLCDVIFGVDTGMQHIAAAVGTTTVSVFGPTNPKTHGAYGEKARFLTEPSACPLQYCYGTKNYTDCPHDRCCLRNIDAKRAFEEVKRSLDTSV